MADNPELSSLVEHVEALTALLAQQQVMLYALHEYLTQQPFFDPVKFADLYEEFDADLVAALKKRPKSASDAVLKMPMTAEPVPDTEWLGELPEK